MTTQKHRRAYRKTLLTAILLTCIAYASFTFGDTVVKSLTGRFRFPQIMVTSSCLSILLISLYGALREGKKAFTTKKPGLMFARAGVSQVISVCNILALPHVQMTTFYTLVFTSPFWVLLLSVFFLKDRLDARRLGVILFSFAVVVCIFRPGSGLFNIWTALVVTGSMVHACQLILMRRIGLEESRAFMMLTGAFLSILVMSPYLPGHFIAPTSGEWALFGLSALLNGIGFLCLTYAFQSAPSASVVAPYHYTQVVWGALTGWFVFHEMPEARVMLGACAIIGAGLYLVWSETRRSRIPDAETAIEA